MTELVHWYDDLWVIYGGHLNLEDAIARHGDEYREETGKEITGLRWLYARREFTGGETEQAYFLHMKKVKGSTMPVTVVA